MLQIVHSYTGFRELPDFYGIFHNNGRFHNIIYIISEGNLKDFLMRCTQYNLFNYKGNTLRNGVCLKIYQ